MGKDLFKNYFNGLEKELEIGNFTEHSFRPILKNLIQSIDKDIVAINEPQRIESGAPDFLITNSNFPTGYIETKKVGMDLDEVEENEQLTRYRQGISNLVLTNYTEFRWYSSGTLILSVEIATVNKNKLNIRPKQYDDFLQLIRGFLVSFARIDTPEELAKGMATYGIYIKRELQQLLKQSKKNVNSLRQQLEGFRLILLEELTEDQLSDMYAQTICYGLFAARISIPEKDVLTRHNSSDVIPKTNPFLRKMFNQIVGPELHDNIIWIVDDLVKLLNSTDINKVLISSNEDPIVHFYETFLSYYDASIKTLRGVYFTPKQVVSYMVKSVDTILKNNFKLEDGLADSSLITNKNDKKLHRVQILDPATGTGTFLNEIINEIYKSFEGNEGMWSGYVFKHLLPRLYGFELLMAPYTVSHMNLSLRLQKSGYDLSNDERLRVYLTNSLEEAHEMIQQPLFSYWLAEEANAAREIKSEVPVMVVIGNPPYFGDSANNNEWIKSLVQDYYSVDNKPLNESNTKWLQDDYVKFIRFGQWRIEQTGTGILAFITNHAYLDNATFRGMRNNLMKSFDEIFVLNLHGNARKQEKTPEGATDENVFDIEQGVAITFFIKHNSKISERPAIYYSDLWGKQTEKYNFLENNDLSSTDWVRINPIEPHYLFVPHDTSNYGEYKNGWKMTEIFNVYSNGIVTARDHFTINWSPDEVMNKIIDFVKLDPESARDKYELRNDVRDWKVQLAQKDVIDSKLNPELIKPIMYRPFDIRYTYYTGNSRGFLCMPRKKVMDNLVRGSNIALITSRLTKGETFKHAYVSRTITDAALLSSKTSNNAFVFPLHLIDNDDSVLINDLVPHHNFNHKFLEDIENKLDIKFVKRKRINKKEFAAKDVLGYIYALLHSNGFRYRYNEYLIRDYPYIPITSNNDLFFRLSELGIQLVDLHLLENQVNIVTKFPIVGTNKIEKIVYKTENNNIGRIYINKKQYFENVDKEVWSYDIGGYQVCEKWLKNRKHRVLSYEDLLHYQKVVSMIKESIQLGYRIDDVIELNGGWPIQ
ncbi:N-6 DNA Methylase [Oceanobacillus limi]|uniref:site-specific DNA-methyltransferase (adenine-specific) n=1 Tax=Oceanobacillus limi TaxID=930131 RepID=A0A1I0EUR7_9BACI|nr:type ISP restriction/modification enzyme [Oceanobacillus limi]SET48863.1 N-6 DNA Methylase [Oceanobacillus limi]